MYSILKMELDYEADNEKGLFPVSFLMDKECALAASFGIFFLMYLVLIEG